jgi:hypothetical protein
VTSRVFAKELDLTPMGEVFSTRFWSKVDIGNSDECWEWQATRNAAGYGNVRLGAGWIVTASRVSLALKFGGKLPKGAVACHTCDNPPCVNPDHLFIGDQSLNAQDSVAKGRANRSRGTAHRDARLNPDAVRYIRSQDTSVRGAMAHLCERYGVSDTAIRRVRIGRTWKHVQ